MEATPRAQRSRAPARAVADASLDPLFWVLALAGFFDGISDNWLHALVLLGAAAAVWWDTWARASGRPVRASVPLLDAGRPTRAWLVLVVLAAAAFSIVVGGFERYTWPPTLAVLMLSVAVLGVGWRGSLRPGPVPARIGRRSALAWSALLVVAGLWELAALLLQPSLQQGSAAHPTVSYLMDTVLAGHAGRSVTLALWLALGWFLLARAPGEEALRRAGTDDAA